MKNLGPSSDRRLQCTDGKGVDETAEGYGIAYSIAGVTETRGSEFFLWEWVL